MELGVEVVAAAGGLRRLVGAGQVGQRLGQLVQTPDLKRCGVMCGERGNIRLDQQACIQQVVQADVGLGLADFRAAERTFQLVTQVVGRAGRGEVPGEAVIQTLYPDHYSIRAAAAQDYDALFDREMTFRKSLAYPPAVALVNVIVTGPTSDDAMADAADLVALVRRQSPRGRVLGPAPAPLARLKNVYRAQFFLKGTNRTAMRESLRKALEATPQLARRTIVDVDPVTML